MDPWRQSPATWYSRISDAARMAIIATTLSRTNMYVRRAKLGGGRLWSSPSARSGACVRSIVVIARHLLSPSHRGRVGLDCLRHGRVVRLLHQLDLGTEHPVDDRQGVVEE